MIQLLTPQEVAEILQVSYETALQFIKYSGIDFLKLGRQYRVEKQKLFTFLSVRGQHIVNLEKENIYHNNNTTNRKRV
ncbi:MAG: helix-turn-helix domain-containing protein [Clostridia bacterium]|nr:helix-turn-helix domain-containing protein [Clostridia bacterium]